MNAFWAVLAGFVGLMLVVGAVVAAEVMAALWVGAVFGATGQWFELGAFMLLLCVAMAALIAWQERQ